VRTTLASRTKISIGLIGRDDASARLAALARHGRYRKSILDDAARRLEEIT
jgi:hypothetical protein